MPVLILQTQQDKVTLINFKFYCWITIIKTKIFFLLLSLKIYFYSHRIFSDRRLQLFQYWLANLFYWSGLSPYYPQECAYYRTTHWVSKKKTLYFIKICVQELYLLLCWNREFIDYIVELTGANVRDFHLIGFSAGAHVVGGAGAAITSGRIPRITGRSIANLKKLPFYVLNW